MALVPAAQGSAIARSEHALAPYGSSSALADPLARERLLERLREDREAHSRKQIWTKDAHGGPYRKVNANKGYDPLIQLPDGSDRQAELGYERVKTWPTSNFVGNHMTQGAIDLVQAQLEPRAPPPLLAAGPAAPRLVHSSAADDPAAPPAPRPLQRYSWVDAGDAVRLEVPLEQLGDCDFGPWTVTCGLQADRLELVLAPGSGQLAPGGNRRTPAPAWRLLVQPLQAAVVPTRCRCYPTGLLALPPSSSEEARMDPAASKTESASGAAGSTGSDSPGQPHCITFALPPGAAAVAVFLAKAGVQPPWEALQARLPLAASKAAGAAGAQPDLLALRKAMRQQLGRGPPPAQPAPAASASAYEPAAAAAASQAANAEAPAAAPDPEACTRALEEAEALVAAGRHADVLATTHTLAASAAGADLAERLRTLRGHCHAQLGNLPEAVREYGAAAELAALAGLASRRSQLLLARASLLEQLEQLEAALADAQEAAALQQPPAPAATLAVARLRRAVRQRCKGG